jgi:hypothetical protein
VGAQQRLSALTEDAGLQAARIDSIGVAVHNERLFLPTVAT